MYLKTKKSKWLSMKRGGLWNFLTLKAGKIMLAAVICGA
jgi:hypothetical protein